jgi:chromosome segregation ATPase
MSDDSWLDYFEEVGSTLSEWVYGPSPKEVLRRSAREIKRSIGQVSRQRTTYEQREAVLKSDLKKRAASAVDAADLAPFVKEIARVRSGIRRNFKMVSSLEGTYQRLLSAQTTATIQNALQEATMAMSMAGGVSNPASLAGTIQSYARANERFEMGASMLEDAVNDDEEESEEVDTLLSQLKDELSLNLNFELPAVQRAREEESALNALTDRIARLKS